MLSAVVKFPSDNSYSENNLVNGYILFKQFEPNLVLVEVNLSGLTPGKHGFHIHEYPINEQNLNLLKKGKKIKDLCKTLGGHFNPFNTRHGSFSLGTTRHAGDLINNINVDDNGKFKIKFYDPLISLEPNKINYIVNKSIVIHEKPDDEGIPGLQGMINKKLYGMELNENHQESLKTGNAGKRIACGNITHII